MTKNNKATISFTANQENNDALKSSMINMLRAQKNLPAKTALTQMMGVHNILKNPDPATVTGVKCERGFSYLNINGGDSWGYYHPEDKPEVLYNFKDEPCYKIKDLDSEYYQRACQHAKKACVKYRKQKKREALEQQQQNQIDMCDAAKQAGDKYHCAFRDKSTDQYYVGCHDFSTANNLFNTVSSKDKAYDFLREHGLDKPELIPTWDLEFRPENPMLFDFENGFVNQYEPSIYLKEAREKKNIAVPRNIKRVIKSALGDDKELYEHFINWLAVIVQYKIRTQTAWVLQGTTGTGKGILFHLIIKPILGEKYCCMVTLANLEEQFNHSLEKCLVLLVDEVDTDQIKNVGKLVAKLKSMITEPRLAIRSMRTDLKEVLNRLNIIMASNCHNSMRIEGNDRRINVCPRQEAKLLKPSEDGTTLVAAISNELQIFTDYLVSYEADKSIAQHVIDNDSKRLLQSITQTAVEEVAEALNEGDLKYFFDHRIKVINGVDAINTIFDNCSIQIGTLYNHLLNEMINYCKSGKRHVLTHLYLFVLFEGLAGGMPKTKSKLSKRLGHSSIFVEPITVKSTSIRGYAVKWSASPAEIKQWEKILTTKK